MTQKTDMPKLTFKTIKHEDKTYCGVRDGGTNLVHRFANERNGHGHDPGYVYLVYLPKGDYKGLYHIGKAEYAKVGMDGFDLDEIDSQLRGRLHWRLSLYHPTRKGTDTPHDGAQFVHGIRVACGEGAEKQPHSFFKLKKLSNREIFDLTEADVETFKTATGSVLDRPIKHLTTKEFVSYLAKDHGFSDKDIREWVFLRKL